MEFPLQLVVNGIVTGSLYALIASGFSLTYSVTKFMDFSYGSIFIASAFSFYHFYHTLSFPLEVSVILAILVGCMMSAFVNFIAYRPLRRRKASHSILLIAGIALMIFINAGILIFWGMGNRTITLNQNPSFSIGEVHVTFVQLLIILTSLAVLTLLWFFLTYSLLGKKFRAVADNKEGAQIAGINPESIFKKVFLFGGGLAGIAGILTALELPLYPHLGTIFIIKALIGAIIGGISSVPGTILGSFLLSFSENIAVWWLPSAFKEAISFSLLILFLLFRPQGILGKKGRAA